MPMCTVTLASYLHKLHVKSWCAHNVYVYLLYITGTLGMRKLTTSLFQFCSCITYQFSVFPWRFLCCLTTTGKMWRVIVAVILETISRRLGSDPALKLREVVWPIEKIEDGICKREAESAELVNTACSLLIFGQCVMTWPHVVRYGWSTAKCRVTGCCALLLQWNGKCNNTNNNNNNNIFYSLSKA
jgi:hypothetical protein